MRSYVLRFYDLKISSRAVMSWGDAGALDRRRIKFQRDITFWKFL